MNTSCFPDDLRTILALHPKYSHILGWFEMNIIWCYHRESENTKVIMIKIHKLQTTRMLQNIFQYSWWYWCLLFSFFSSYSNYYSEDGEFMLVSNSSFQKVTVVEGITYTSMTMSLTLQRRPTYYILNMVLPCVVLSMLSSLAFCLPVSCGERVSLQITVILSFGIYQMMLTEYIPNHATKIPLLST